MGHQKAVAALLVILLAGAGCASLRWGVKKALREPGEKIETFPELVWEEFDCDIQKRPFFVVEINELVPPKVYAGGEFNHRIVYVMCPLRPTQVLEGRLSTRIRFKGDPIVREIVEPYEIKPGRWVVDAFVSLPDDAEPGVYAYELEFRHNSLRFDKQLTFVVLAR